MDPKVEKVLSELEQRSRSEQAELETLRKGGGESVIREAHRFMLDVGREAGEALNLIARMTNAKLIVEVGGSTGYSTVWLAEAARAVGGRVISYDINEGKQREQREYLARAGLEDVVEIVLGDAHELLRTLDEPVDMVLLDHYPKSAYGAALDLIWSRLGMGGVVVADNILEPKFGRADGEAFLDHARSLGDARVSTLPVGQGLGIVVKTSERTPRKQAVAV